MHSSRTAPFFLLASLCACSGEEQPARFGAGAAGVSSSGSPGTAGSGGTTGGGTSGKAGTSGMVGVSGSTSAGGRVGAGGAATMAGSAGGPSTSAGAAGSGPTLPTDPSGFTELVPSQGTVTIYVSSGSGNDSNTGRSPEQAVRSVQRGVALLRDNQPDWLLFKRGDVWEGGLGGWALSGRSATERMVVGAYGEGARPRFEFEDEALATNGGISEKEYLDNLVFTSLHFLGEPHDPSRGTPSGPNPTCISWLRGGRDVLFEDMRFEFCAVHVTHFDGFRAERFRFHRNLFLDSYSVEDAHAQAILLHGVESMVLEENVFDRCGWHPDFQVADPTIFNHCIYWQQDGPADGIVRNNIIMRASSHGAQMRSSGRVEGNVFVRNAIGGFIAGNFEVPPAGDVEGTVIGNLFTDAEDITPRDGHSGEDHRGWGWDFSPDGRLIQNAVIRDNIFAHCKASDCKSIVRTYPDTTIESNIVWNWTSTVSSYLPNSAGPFTDPDRTVGSYNESLGGTDSFEAFAAEVRQQSKTNWRPAYSAQQIIAYFRGGLTAP